MQKGAVKSTTGDEIAFFISREEIDFAEAHKDNYEIYIVINLNDAIKRRIINLGNIFDYTIGETFTNNNKFIVETKEYRIRSKYEEISDETITSLVET